LSRASDPGSGCPNDLRKVTPIFEVTATIGAAVERGQEVLKLVIVPQVGDGLCHNMRDTDTGCVVGGAECSNVLAISTSTRSPVLG
jgi:hypothetical protein